MAMRVTADQVTDSESDGPPPLVDSSSDNMLRGAATVDYDQVTDSESQEQDAYATAASSLARAPATTNNASIEVKNKNKRRRIRSKKANKTKKTKNAQSDVQWSGETARSSTGAVAVTVDSMDTQKIKRPGHTNEDLDQLFSQMPTLPTSTMEVFYGTGSLSAALKGQGFLTSQLDILDDNDMMLQRHPMHLAPPCNTYSRASWPRVRIDEVD